MARHRGFVSELLKQYFPGVASLYSRVNDFWVEKSKIGMEFGLFFNLAINMDMGGVRVRSTPHRDVLNIAFGTCIIMPFGELVLLVCWTAMVAHMPQVFFLMVFPHGSSTWRQKL